MEILTANLHPRIGNGPPAANSPAHAAWRAVGNALALALLFAVPAPAQVDEYRLKAAFLYNFAKFVEWPPHTFTTAADPITICILGRNPFGNTLNQIVSGKVAAGRTLVVRQIPNPQSVSGCPILFVAASENKRFRAMVDTLRDSGVLTVGETDGFAAEGGVINFKLEAGNVRLEINTDAADLAKVRISSKLLSLAQIVRKSP